MPLAARPVRPLGVQVRPYLEHFRHRRCVPCVFVSVDRNSVPTLRRMVAALGLVWKGVASRTATDLPNQLEHDPLKHPVKASARILAIGHPRAHLPRCFRLNANARASIQSLFVATSLSRDEPRSNTGIGLVPAFCLSRSRSRIRRTYSANDNPKSRARCLARR